MSQNHKNTAFNTLDAIIARQTQDMLSDFHRPKIPSDNHMQKPMYGIGGAQQ